VVLLDGAAAAKEGHKEDDAAHNDQEDWSVEELYKKHDDNVTNSYNLT